MAGLLAQEYGQYDRALPEAFQFAQGFNNVLRAAQDEIELRKQQQMRNEYNQIMLDEKRQMSPLDIMKASAEARSADAMATPEMLLSKQEGYKAQNLLQKLNANKTEALYGSDLANKLAGNEVETEKSKQQKELYRLYSVSQDKSQPDHVRISAMTELNAKVGDISRMDPEFWKKKTLADEAHASSEKIAEGHDSVKLRTAKAASTLHDAFMSGRLSPAKAAVVADFVAEQTTDPEERLKLKQMAARYHEASLSEKREGNRFKSDPGPIMGTGPTPQTPSPYGTTEGSGSLSDSQLINKYQ